MYSSWYDGTTSWVVATPGDKAGLFNYSASLTPPTPIQPQKILQTGINSQVMYAFWQIGAGGVSPLNYGRIAGTQYLHSAGMGGNFSGLLLGAASPWQWGPSSDHSGGFVLHSWGDAHVSGLAEDIDPTTYVQLCSRAGKETASDPGQ
jgi:hypothetical protein